MIITQGIDSNIIPAHGRNVIIVDECNGPLEITAVITGLSGSFTFVRQPLDGRVKFEVGAIAKQVYRKLVDYVDPFDYSATTVYGTSDPYHFAALSIVLFDGTSQINLSYRVLNAAIQLGDADLDSYVGSVLSYMDCDDYTPPANLDPIAISDAFNGEQGVELIGNVILGNPAAEQLLYNENFDSPVSFNVSQCELGLYKSANLDVSYGVDSFTNDVIIIESNDASQAQLQLSHESVGGYRYRFSVEVTQDTYGFPGAELTLLIRNCQTLATSYSGSLVGNQLFEVEYTAQAGTSTKIDLFTSTMGGGYAYYINSMSLERIEIYPFEDYDPDGDTITVGSYTIAGVTYPFGTLVVIPSVGTLIIEANGDMTFTPNGLFIGTYIFEYTITDGNGGTDTAKVSLVIAESGIYAEQYQTQYE